MAGLNTHCVQRLHDELPDIVELLARAVDGAELAMLARTVPDALALWGHASYAVQRGFREAVRDRYAVLVEEQHGVLEPR